MADAAPAEHQVKTASAPASTEGIYLEDWLGYISGSSFVLTDSFHGMCLAILLHKPFVALSNMARGAVRFQDVLRRLGLEERLCSSLRELPKKLHLLDQPIDFDEVEQRLVQLRKDSLSWLKTALTQVLPAKELTDYDLLAERCFSGERAIGILQNKCADTEKAAAIWWEQLEDHRLRLDGLDAQVADALRLSCEASTTDIEQWKQLEDHRLRLDSLEMQAADALRLSREASATDEGQWKQLEDHRLRLDGLDTKMVESTTLADATKAELSEQLNHLKELIYVLEQRNMELQGEVKRLEESSLHFWLKKFMKQMLFWT